MSTKLEKDIEETYVGLARLKYRAKALKLILKDERGFPDRTVIFDNGYIFFIEFKRNEKEKTSPQQDITIKELRSQGCKVYICWTVEQAMKVTEEEFMLNG